mgnify:CR=1 FL=1
MLGWCYIPVMSFYLWMIGINNRLTLQPAVAYAVTTVLVCFIKGVTSSLSPQTGDICSPMRENNRIALLLSWAVTHLCNLSTLIQASTGYIIYLYCVGWCVRSVPALLMDMTSRRAVVSVGSEYASTNTTATSATQRLDEALTQLRSLSSESNSAGKRI